MEKNREKKAVNRELKKIERAAMRDIIKYEREQADCDLQEMDKELRKLDIRLEKASSYILRRSRKDSRNSIIGSVDGAESMFEKVVGPIYLMKLYEIFGRYFDIVVKPALPKVNYGKD